MLKVLKKTRKAKKENLGMKKRRKKEVRKKLKLCEEEDHNSDDTIIIGSNESHDFLWE
jgi:low affinity Fe/Cu permease